MYILITGAFGFVGSNLLKVLKTLHVHHLIAIDIAKSENLLFDEYFSWDELEKVDWEKIDAIIHLAGKAHDTKKTTDEKAYFDINVGLTQQIFEYFLQSNASKFIFFSSVKAAVDTLNSIVLTEDLKPNPETPYGKSKLKAEKHITSQLQSSVFGLRSTYKKAYILRPCIIYGPGNKGKLNLLYKLVSKGIPWPLGAFENGVRSYRSTICVS